MADKKKSSAKGAEKKKTGRGKRFLAVVLCLLLALFAAGIVIPWTETDAGETVAGSADWMAGLDDSLFLNEINLPGTHDSATQFVHMGFFGKCQTKTIGEQLSAGFRYLDIRLAVDGARLKLMHGFVDCQTGAMPWDATLYLDAVLSDCYAFLQAHPTETVVFAIKKEHGSDSVADFQRLLDAYLAEQPEYWLLTDRMPTLGQARGKLVLLRRYDDEGGLGERAGIPLNWEGQSGSSDTSLHTVAEPNGSYTLYVQDRFCYPTEEKWSAFMAGLGAGDPARGELTLSFLSTKGTLPFGHPYKYAAVLNARLLAAELSPHCGWIVVDFATAPLAAHIYGTNFND